MVEMHLVGVRVELPTNNPIVLLREAEGDHRVLPIFIGAVEATAIAFALQELPEAFDLVLLVVLADHDRGLVEHGLVGEDRRAQAGGQGDGVRRAARHLHLTAVLGHLDVGVEGALP